MARVEVGKLSHLELTEFLLEISGAVNDKWVACPNPRQKELLRDSYDALAKGMNDFAKAHPDNFAPPRRVGGSVDPETGEPV